MRPKAFIHVGPHKTASTYIQTRLFRDAKFLDDSGFFYSCPPKLGPGHAHIANLLKRGDNEAFLNLFAKKSSENNSQHIILSSENFCNLSASSLSVVLGLIPQSYDLVLIYAYRPVLEQLKSFFQQKLRAGHPLDHACAADWIKVLTSNDISAVYLKDMLSTCQVMGAEFRAMKIQRDETYNPYHNFLSIMGLPCAEITRLMTCMDQSKGENRTLGALTQLQLSWINRLFPMEDLSLKLFKNDLDRLKLARLMERGFLPGLAANLADKQNLKDLQDRVSLIAENLIIPPPEIVHICSEIDAFKIQLLRPFLSPDCDGDAGAMN
jgi:hypothetical protein